MKGGVVRHRSSTRAIISLIGVVLVFAFTGSALASADRLPSKAIERPAAHFNRQARAAAMHDLHDALARESVELGLNRPMEVRVDPDVLRDVERGTARVRKIKVGATADVSVRVDFSDLDIPRLSSKPFARPFGAMRAGASGFVWTGAIRSPDAAALRIHIEDLDLPEGNELYAWTRDGMAFGPYTGRGPNGTGELWTNAVDGDEVVLQIRGSASGDGAGLPSFRITGVGHVTSKFRLAGSLNPQASTTKTCPYNAVCVVDVACVSTDPAVDTAKDAVAEMLFASGAYLYLCTGGLVADSDTSTNVPYFITAHHCISKNNEAASLETYFFYRAETCGACPDWGFPSTNGSSVVSTNRSSDYSLLQLSQPAPSGAAFLGWNANPVANTDGETLYRISHPQGAAQSYSVHVVDTSKPTCRSWPRGNWIYSRDIFGATEGGSSGSPVVNAAGELVGELSGGCGYNVGDVCDSQSNATVDGAFAAYYDSVAAWLGPGGGGPTPEDCTDGIDNDGDGLVDCDDPDCTGTPSCSTGTCTDADGDGWCVEDGDCNDNDRHVHPGANDTKGRWGRDGVDNDCNGIIDG